MCTCPRQARTTINRLSTSLHCPAQSSERRRATSIPAVETSWRQSCTSPCQSRAGLCLLQVCGAMLSSRVHSAHFNANRLWYCRPCALLSGYTTQVRTLSLCRCISWNRSSGSPQVCRGGHEAGACRTATGAPGGAQGRAADAVQRALSSRVPCQLLPQCWPSKAGAQCAGGSG